MQFGSRSFGKATTVSRCLACAVLAIAIQSCGFVQSCTYRKPIDFNQTAVDRSFGGGDCKGLADIDGDGRLDVIAGKKRDLAWYRYPGWEKHVIAPAQQEFTTDMQIADVDGDGDPDVVAPDGERGEVAWYENPRPQGDPSASGWKKHLIGYQGTWAHDVEVADMNGDGKLDVVTRKTETLLWLQEDSGSFSKVVVASALPDGEGTALADINKDGRIDIVQNGYWLESPADPRIGEWRKHVIAEGWPRQLGVSAADLNGDGRLDVLLGPAESQGKLAWFEAPSNPAQEMWQEHVIDNDVEYLHTFQVADVDNNGFPDIVTAEMHQSRRKRVSVYFQFVDRAVWHPVVIARTGSHNLRIGDIDGDGDIDILGANWGGSYAPLEVWMNQLIDRSHLPMEPGWTYTRVDGNRGKWGDFDSPVWMKYFGLAAGDVGGRGVKDIASGRYFYWNPGDASGAWRRTELPVNADAMLMFDVDGDGRDDIIAEALPNVYWLKPEDPAGEAWKAIVVAKIPGTEHGNGQGYALLKTGPGSTPAVILSSGAGIYQIRVPADPTSDSWPTTQVAQGTSEEGVATGDIDRDGLADVAGSSAKDGKILWFKNPGKGDGLWKSFEIGRVENIPDRIAIADLNRDGRLDVVVSEETWPEMGPASVYWFEQPADPNESWSRHTIVTQFTTNSLDVADLTGDGVPDVITGEHRGARKLAIWENLSQGKSWRQHVVDTGKESHLGARAFDLDGDGRSEILSICWDTYQNLHLWRKQFRPQKP